MRKRKIWATTVSKSKMLKVPTIDPHSMNLIASKEWRCLGKAFRETSVASTSAEDIDDVGDEVEVMKAENELDEIESIPSRDTSFNEGLEVEIEDIHEDWTASECTGNDEKEKQSVSANNLCESISSPTSSPNLKSISKAKGSVWVKNLPDISCEMVPKQERRHRRLNLVKGGFAEQLDRLLCQKQPEVGNRNQKSDNNSGTQIQLIVKDVSRSGGLLIAQCSKFGDEVEQASVNLEEDCILVVQNEMVEKFSITCGAIITIKPPWQALQVNDNCCQTYLIGPTIVRTDGESRDLNQGEDGPKFTIEA